MHADPEHHWDISTVTVKEALASWKGKAVKAAMDEEIRIGTWELVERPPGHRRRPRTPPDAARHEERQPAEQAQQGAVHVPIDGTDQVCKLLKSMYGLKQLPLLWYKALDYVLMGVGWKKSQVDQALYFKVGGDGMACWVLVYVDDLLAASSSTVLLKELLEASFKRHEISPVEKYLGLEIVHDWTARKPWLHQQAYVDKLHRRFIDKENTERTPKTPVSVNAYAELKFDDTETQERQEEDYRPKVGSLQFAATTTRPDIAFMCSKLGSSFTVRSNQVDHCLAYLANTRNTAVEFGGGPDSLKLVGYLSQRIKCAMLSSTESEYVAATEAGKEGRRLHFLLVEFRLLDAGTPTVLRVDNKSAITATERMGLVGNLKYME
ncbi:unnamed protein product [Closterium sp. NIES-53]